MKLVVGLRKWHKWLAVFAGFQIALWAASGLYMTAIDLDLIHGDHLVKPTKAPQLSEYPIQPIDHSVFQQYAPYRWIRLVNYFDQPVYELKTKKQLLIVNALTGKLMQNLPKVSILNNADQIYAGNAKIKSAKLLAKYPSEIGGKKEAVWQLTYDDIFASSLYFHPQSGKLLKKRSHLWRTFDLLWILHIAQYAGGVTGWFFRLLSLLSMATLLAGSVLLVLRLKTGQLERSQTKRKQTNPNQAKPSQDQDNKTRGEK